MMPPCQTILSWLIVTTTILATCLELVDEGLDTGLDQDELESDFPSYRQRRRRLHDNLDQMEPPEDLDTFLRRLQENGDEEDLGQNPPQPRKKNKRKKRAATLVWPSGSRFVAEFYFVIPISAPTGVTIPFTIDVPYRFTLPNITTSWFGDKSKKLNNKNDFHDRLDVYGVVEGLFNQFGMDGKTCVLRAVCERAQLNLVHTGMLGEVIATVLSASLSGYSDEMYDYQVAEYYGSTHADCQAFYPSCPISLFNWLE